MTSLTVNPHDLRFVVIASSSPANGSVRAEVQPRLENGQSGVTELMLFANSDRTTCLLVVLGNQDDRKE